MKILTRPAHKKHAVTDLINQFPNMQLHRASLIQANFSLISRSFDQKPEFSWIVLDMNFWDICSTRPSPINSDITEAGFDIITTLSLLDTHIRIQTQQQWGKRKDRAHCGPQPRRPLNRIRGDDINIWHFQTPKTMKDNEDGIIDLVFYCVGCNIVDILGMVGELRPMVNFILLHVELFSLDLCFLAPSHPWLHKLVFYPGNTGVLFILLTPGLLKHKTGFHK